MLRPFRFNFKQHIQNQASLSVSMGTVMETLKEAWFWMGYVDQGLVFIFIPLLIVLLVKVRRLENAAASQQGSVNIAVAAPAAVPMKVMDPMRQSIRRGDPYDQYRQVYN